MPSTRFARNAQTQLSMKNDLGATITKALGIAAIGFSLGGTPMMPANADGAVSDGTRFRARNFYGLKIYNLKDAVAKGDLSVFDKKVSNAFDLFISQANFPSIKGKALAKEETALKSELFAAVASKDTGKVKSAYEKFIKTASLVPAYKLDEPGQTDSSGYSPTWGTEREQIYIR